MMDCREIPVSAHHNYLVNGILAQGFVVGDPGLNNKFFLLADVVPQGETGPRISARLLDGEAHLLLQLKVNRIGENPGRYRMEPTSDGYRIIRSSADVLIEVKTEAFANGYLTRIKARLFDEDGHLCLETRGESIRIHRGECRYLAAPFSEGAST
jgi:hypothetical protein